MSLIGVVNKYDITISFIYYLDFSFSNINISMGEVYKKNNQKKGIYNVITIW